jgi:hypothetical protein
MTNDFRQITPIKTIEGNSVTSVENGVLVEVLYKGEARLGVVENGTNPIGLTLQTGWDEATGKTVFRTFTRSKIERLAFVL